MTSWVPQAAFSKGHTRYYDPLAPSLRTLFTWHATVFELVFSRPEFYGYIVWNLAATTVCIFWVEEGVIETFNWDAASIMQYVMTFFVTFYNDKCFERYSLLYPACTDFMENTTLLIQEMNVSLPWRDLHYHRLACAKYLLAVVYEYFLIVCGGKLQTKGWEELMKKGLLTKEEVKLLEQFPGGESTFVLTSWVLFIIRDALVQDCMWRNRTDRPPDWQPQQTVHIFNRHCTYVVEMQRAAHKIGYTMANPIPFAYYHLANIILVFNIMLLSTFSALFRSYFSVLPFGIALLVYMGLREISTALADPFGGDSVDFPVPDLLRSCFDNTVSQLLAFMRADVRPNILGQIENVEEFHEKNLRRFAEPGLFADDDEPTKGTATTVQWPSKGVFEGAKPDADIAQKIKHSFSAKAYVDERPKKEKVLNPFKDRKKAGNQALMQQKILHKDIEIKIAEAQAEYEKVLKHMDTLIDRYPDLEEAEAAIHIPENLHLEDGYDSMHDSASSSAAMDADAKVEGASEVPDTGSAADSKDPEAKYSSDIDQYDSRMSILGRKDSRVTEASDSKVTVKPTTTRQSKS